MTMGKGHCRKGAQTNEPMETVIPVILGWIGGFSLGLSIASFYWSPEYQGNRYLHIWNKYKNKGRADAETDSRLGGMGFVFDESSQTYKNSARGALRVIQCASCGDDQGFFFASTKGLLCQSCFDDDETALPLPTTSPAAQTTPNPRPPPPTEPS
jgi:hypothetical protein